jgi:hypothetical protein
MPTDTNIGNPEFRENKWSAEGQAIGFGGDTSAFCYRLKDFSLTFE